MKGPFKRGRMMRPAHGVEGGMRKGLSTESAFDLLPQSESSPSQAAQELRLRLQGIVRLNAKKTFAGAVSA